MLLLQVPLSQFLRYFFPLRPSFFCAASEKIKGNVANRSPKENFWGYLMQDFYRLDILQQCQITEGNTSDFFQWAPCTSTRGHSFKLYKNSCSAHVRSTFFSERIVNVWNGLPANVDFSSLRSFTRTVKLADLSVFLKCYNYSSFLRAVCVNQTL